MTRCLVSQVPEDIFNVGKASVDRQKTKVCTPEHIMGVALDREVLTKTHKYQTISKEDAPQIRVPLLTRKDFQPVFAASKLTADCSRHFAN